MVISTLHKDGVPRDWAYPIGAEILSAGIGGCPQAELVKLRFSVHRPRTRGPKSSRNVWKGQPVSLISYHYRPATPHSPKSWESWHVPTWEVEIYAVESNKSSTVRDLLTQQGLPNHVRPWLIANWKLHGRELYARLRLSLNIDGTLLIKEESGGIGAQPIED